ncbi:glucose-6-phosphate dehydrogenase [Corynebacterium guangdongense]|uniref:Glucose-6-phosphate 1-dehydrogenase n=1 Tax=Corynebacterium guangdongense TaxID=1783348 RepID=A0ABU1ZYE3_9CORY|nr:glucose-6-phosphate dehydrogenase [Corynebacterium guangdongense]MDR7329946.1 glucose-6-phosphate 1-dehydrogenase [Corynebacterium guangdongense]WJZ18504.1 Glucose-6-phosphate 1-dehydrogenase [Corynebacterium guangdongense]
MTTFLILGGQSDLAGRLLIPGIADYLSQVPDAEIRIVGSGRSEVEDYPGYVRDAVRDSDVGGLDESVVTALADAATWITADATSAEDMSRAVAKAGADGGPLILYYALAPTVTEESVQTLREVDLPEGTVLAMEKPFGTDAASAAELEEKLLRVVEEKNLFRVDHFLAESATLNLVGVLDANRIFQAGWSAEAVESIEVVHDESLGLEGRAEFYDATGALEDMLQSHLILTAASILAAGPGQDTITSILAAMNADVEHSHRARYTAGTVAGEELPAYVDEEGVDPARDTETLAQVRLHVDTERWRGVPVTLRSGKAIGDPLAAITVTYRPTEQDPEAPTTRLVVPFGDELHVDLNVADHSDREQLRQTRLSGELSPSRLTPYARVVRALVEGDDSLEVPAGAPALAWSVLQPVIDAFDSGRIAMVEYPAGSHGPESFFAD